jgi:hypothetical protein
MSRRRFAERFTELVGITPMTDTSHPLYLLDPSLSVLGCLRRNIASWNPLEFVDTNCIEVICICPTRIDRSYV